MPKISFKRLRGLDRPDDAGQHADHARLLTGGHQAGGRRGLEDATITGGLLRHDGRHSAIESEDPSMDQWFSGKETGVVDEKLGREIIDPVDDHIVLADNLEGIAGRQPLFVHRRRSTSGLNA